MKATLARGAKGDLIERLQQALSKIAVPTEGGQQEPAIATVDGDFGRSTQLAIQRVQAKFGKPITGVVDAELWELISKEADWPGKFERCLGLVAAFEGHGYTKAAGNWDKAGITWGIIRVHPDHVRQGQEEDCTEVRPTPRPIKGGVREA